MVTDTAVMDAPMPAQTTTAGPCSIDVVTDEAVFLDLEAEWNDAVDRAGLTHPFLRHEWIRTWWECFGSGARLHIVIVRAGGRIAAIAPLMSETVWMYGLPVRRLRLLHNDHTPRAEFIVAERPEDSYRALWSALRQNGGWDVLQLGQVPQRTATGQTMRTLATVDSYKT